VSPARPSRRTDRGRSLRGQEPARRRGTLDWKVYGYAVAAMSFCFLLLALFVWLRPLVVLEALTHARLFYNGFHNESVTLGGQRIHYYEGGHGNRSVVLVHGLGGRAEDWASLMPQLKDAGFHVYAIDLLGYGHSAQPADATYSVPEEAQYVAAFLAHNNLEHVNLVGWSMGGWVAMRVALDHPERIARLVLCDAAGLRFDPVFTADTMAPTDVDGIQRLYRLIMPNPLPVPEFLARDMLRRFQKTRWVVQRSAQSMFHGEDLLDGKLAPLTMPTLIVWGSQDHLIPPAVGVALHHEIPQSVLQIYEGCGHLAPGQCSDRIAPRMIGFFDGKPPQAAAQEMIPAH